MYILHEGRTTVTEVVLVKGARSVPYARASISIYKEQKNKNLLIFYLIPDISCLKCAAEFTVRPLSCIVK